MGLFLNDSRINHINKKKTESKMVIFRCLLLYTDDVTKHNAVFKLLSECIKGVIISATSELLGNAFECTM